MQNVPNVHGHLTGLGHLVVEQTEDGHVKATLRSRNPELVRYGVTVTDGEVTLDMWEGPRPPKPGQEVTVDGASVEVTKVETDPDGAIWVYGDNGRKVRWE